MSKFLLNLLEQISKALVYSKIKFYSENNFPRHFQPIRPFGPVFLFFTGRFSLPFPLGLSLPAGPAHPHGPTGHLFFFLPHRSQARTAPPPAGLVPPPRSPPTPPPEEKNGFNPAIEAPSSWQLKALGPPPPHLRPIKADPSHD
jgi:hypothetical protein